MLQMNTGTRKIDSTAGLLTTMGYKFGEQEPHLRVEQPRPRIAHRVLLGHQAHELRPSASRGMVEFLLPDEAAVPRPMRHLAQGGRCHSRHPPGVPKGPCARW